MRQTFWDYKFLLHPFCTNGFSGLFYSIWLQQTLLFVKSLPWKLLFLQKSLPQILHGMAASYCIKFQVEAKVHFMSTRSVLRRTTILFTLPSILTSGNLWLDHFVVFSPSWLLAGMWRLYYSWLRKLVTLWVMTFGIELCSLSPTMMTSRYSHVGLAS